jgi:hypothetical protein
MAKRKPEGKRKPDFIFIERDGDKYRARELWFTPSGREYKIIPLNLISEYECGDNAPVIICDDITIEEFLR